MFLLFAAGIIAFQNSRMLAERENDASRAYTGHLMYSVYHQDFAPNGELPEAVPLFQFTLFDGMDGTTNALCRVAAGRGEMVLSDAQNYMLSNLRQAALQGVRFEYLSFPGKAARRGEKEMIKALETVAKQEAEYANHSE
ncbi:hypothetical protein PBOR_15995 [Paenibacillus borealis]|uniref:Uncharacterized protein n=1 Tax=Paenibacillus borealis TaxID=160799 RepID=A0A089LGJ2_PAEBO|nr:hypothetical protein PBOR_15995 [Paenibacillus borealis]